MLLFLKFRVTSIGKDLARSPRRWATRNQFWILTTRLPELGQPPLKRSKVQPSERRWIPSSHVEGPDAICGGSRERVYSGIGPRPQSRWGECSARGHPLSGAARYVRVS